MITVPLTLIVVGVLLWLVQTYIPMPGWMKTVINVVAVVLVVLYLLQVFGLMGYLDAPVPNLRHG